MPTSGSPAVRRRRLAAELRRLRGDSHKTAEEVGEILGWSKAKVSRYELARSGLRPRDVAALLDLYGVRGEQRERLLALAEEATQKGWWEAYSDVLTEEHVAFIGLEAEATSVLQWQITVVPGLLQTQQYAWHVISGFQGVRSAPSTVIERRVQTRLIRQQVLTRDQPLELTAVLDESVLRRQRGDRSVMYEQLQYLAEVSELPNVTVKILPLEGPKGLALDSFQILQFGRAHETQLHDVVSAESVHANIYVEGETDTHEFRLAFERLAQDALEPEESREFILRTARQLWALSAGFEQLDIPGQDVHGIKSQGMHMNNSLSERRNADRGRSYPFEHWRKSSFSGSNGDCVEVAVMKKDAYVGIRDSKATTGPYLRFRPDVWTIFVADIRSAHSPVGDLIL